MAAPPGPGPAGGDCVQLAVSRLARWSADIGRHRNQVTSQLCRAATHSGYDDSCVCSKIIVPPQCLLNELARWRFKQSGSHAYLEANKNFLGVFKPDIVQLVFQMSAKTACHTKVLHRYPWYRALCVVLQCESNVSIVYVANQLLQVNQATMVHRLTPIWVCSALDSLLQGSQLEDPALAAFIPESIQDQLDESNRRFQDIHVLSTIIGRLVNVQPIGFGRRPGGAGGGGPFCSFIKVRLEFARQISMPSCTCTI